MNKKLLWSSALLMAIGLSAAEKLFHAQFTRNGWEQDKWQMVKSWRWDYLGSWIQRPDCIENRCPDVADKSELLDLRAGETYTAMLVKEKFSGNTLISCEMEFTDRMAPGIIIALEPPVQDSKGRQELREHLEIILWDEGINVWHHFFVDGEQQWRRAAYLKNEFHAGTRYGLNISIVRNADDSELSVEIDNHIFGVAIPNFPDEYQLGIVGCEGSNLFYDFSVAEGIQTQ